MINGLEWERGGRTKRREIYRRDYGWDREQQFNERCGPMPGRTHLLGGVAVLLVFWRRQFRLDLRELGQILSPARIESGPCDGARLEKEAASGHGPRADRHHGLPGKPDDAART